MPRVKGAIIARKKRRKILKETKGYRWGRKSKERLAREALLHAYSHAFKDRKRKKREKRRLWIVKINAFVRNEGLPYKEFIHLLEEKNIKIDRKILAQLAEEKPEIMKKILDFVKS
ncbi:MAG: 50S ribosomal protein L20 [Candidatus Paceibacterota bacterium]